MSNPIPASLADAFEQLCQGNFSYRLPRTLKRDEQDTVAFFFNSVAEELDRIVVTTREQEQRLEQMTDALSKTLLKAAAGDLTAQADRDFKGDRADVLIYLVNNTISELHALVTERQRQGELQREKLERLVEERTGQLGESEENFRTMFEASPVAMILTRLSDDTVLAANEQASALFDIPKGEVVGQRTPDFWTDAQERARLLARVSASGVVDGFQAKFRRRSGEIFWGDLAVRLVQIGGQRALLTGVRDITEQKVMEEKLRELATTDSLTGTLNRRRLFEVAREEVDRAERYGRPLAVAMVDLDSFKSVNDQFGHAAGDEALRQVAGAIRQQLRRPDWVGRYGGEELVVLYPETELEAARVVTERIRAAVEGLKLTFSGRRLSLTLSAGLVAWRTGESFADAVRRADEGLYQAKAAGRNRVVAVP